MRVNTLHFLDENKELKVFQIYVWLSHVLRPFIIDVESAPKQKTKSKPLLDSYSLKVDSDLARGEAVKFDLRHPWGIFFKNGRFLLPHHYYKPTGGFDEWEELQYRMEN